MKVKATELRIGNLHQGAPLSIPRMQISSDGVSAITAYGIHLVQSEQIEFIPILITGNWLIRLGFENWGKVTVNEYEYYDRWVIHNIIDGTSNFEFHIINSKYGDMGHTENICSIDNDERIHTSYNLVFIHQLQNIYFTLTGNELDTELK